METQKNWVLLSASADHPTTSKGLRFSDRELIEKRAINSQQPSELRQHLPLAPLFSVPRRHRCAILLTGELRCLKRSQKFLSLLAQQADFFIVTSDAFRKAAHHLAPQHRVLIVDEHDSERQTDHDLPLGSMKQWHKLAMGLKLVESSECSRNLRYSYVLKLRSDYFYVHPQRLLNNVVQQCKKPETGLIGASDKVFAGSRDLMMLFKGFFNNIEGWFNGREDRYWPINVDQILASDDAFKWYGMNWPEALVGQPESTEKWRKLLIDGGKDLSVSLARYEYDEHSRFYRLFQGHQRFASEVCFARFLNFNGIPFHDCYSLRGFLYSDRNSFL